ncbi:hypothetical protein S40285_09433 [Stachybotrys chlorohalonatus IBT 40285]|uniref:Uncharacterized protein n=1 Tax=Stachybotrys chlorohalonatus (strain IBT 40285) TaxID=1283841 RepID=A0A084Q9T1_STAC4|nr:hypothetical protein S40285_09433 [Stachybotrys chlorohalonata IBT 40285]
MQHDPHWTTFYSPCYNHAVEFDIQNAVLRQPNQDRLIKMLMPVSLTRDPRASRDMVLEQVWANISPDPEIVGLEERRAQLKAGRYRIKGQDDEEEIRKRGEKIRNKRAKRDRTIQE